MATTACLGHEVRLAILTASLMIVSLQGITAQEGVASPSDMWIRRLAAGDSVAASQLERGGEWSLAVLRHVIESDVGEACVAAAQVAGAKGRVAAALAPLLASKLRLVHSAAGRVAIAGALARIGAADGCVVDALWQALVRDPDFSVRKACAEACCRLDPLFLERVVDRERAGALAHPVTAEDVLCAAGGWVVPQLIAKIKEGAPRDSLPYRALMRMGWVSSDMLVQAGMVELAACVLEWEAQRHVTFGDMWKFHLPRDGISVDAGMEFFAAAAFQPGGRGILRGAALPDGRLSLTYVELRLPEQDWGTPRERRFISEAVVEPDVARALQMQISAIGKMTVEVAMPMASFLVREDGTFEADLRGAIVSNRVLGAVLAGAGGRSAWIAHYDGYPSTGDHEKRWRVEAMTGLLRGLWSAVTWESRLAGEADWEFECPQMSDFLDLAREWESSIGDLARAIERRSGKLNRRPTGSGSRGY